MEPKKCISWAHALHTLLNLAPRPASAAHWRWALSCMAATSERGATGFLRQGNLRPMLRRANSSSALGTTAFKAALSGVSEQEQQANYPQWLRTAPFDSMDPSSKLLDARQVTGMLLQLCTSSQRIGELLDQYAANGPIGVDEWMEFVREQQQLASSDSARLTRATPQHDVDAELSRAQRRFEEAVLAGRVDAPAEQKISRLQFALLLLSAKNDAVGPILSKDENDDLGEPLPLYWTSASHNSYIIGDQLTGLSKADMYRRLLLQVRCGTPRGVLMGSAAPLVPPQGAAHHTTRSFHNLGFVSPRTH
eukprot:2720222-Prymnesium_polylepis.3